VVPNQFNTGDRPPFKRKDDQVTKEIVILALLYAVLGSSLLVGLMKWLG